MLGEVGEVPTVQGHSADWPPQGGDAWKAARPVLGDHVGVEDDAGHGRSVTVPGPLLLAHLLDVQTELFHLLVGVEQVAPCLERLRTVRERRDPVSSLQLLGQLQVLILPLPRLR
jgi:hypothetical protein